VAPTTPSTALNLGFLTILHEASGYLGGYLVTNVWGRPLEFRLSTAVQPNRVQQILYGGTLQPYICADLIGRTLIEKATIPVNLVITDRDAVLDLRRRVEFPVVWLVGSESSVPEEAEAFAWRNGQGQLVCHPEFGQDAAAARAVLGKPEVNFDLAEPFARIREAIAEARRSGVVTRSGAA
jgi:hypothetical protein